MRKIKFKIANWLFPEVFNNLELLTNELKRLKGGKQIYTVEEMLQSTSKRLLQLENYKKVVGITPEQLASINDEITKRQESMEILLSNFKKNDYVKQ